MTLIRNGRGDQRHRLDCRVHAQVVQAPVVQAVDARVVPHIWPIAAMAAQLDVVPRLLISIIARLSSSSFISIGSQPGQIVANQGIAQSLDGLGVDQLVDRFQ